MSCSTKVFDHVTIGNDVTISSYTILLCHDGSTARWLGYGKIGRITIGDKVFIGMRSLIMPGVTIGENSIIGAGSVVTRDIPANVVAAGNPARVIYDLNTFIERRKARMKVLPVLTMSIFALTPIRPCRTK